MSGEYEGLSKERVYQLLERAKAGDEAAIEELVMKNAGLVRMVSLKFSAMGYDGEDLMQVGFIGLLKAIRGFDPAFDVMFSTYAVPMILGEMRRFVRDDGKIKVGRQIKQNVHLVRSAEERYIKETGEHPRVSELVRMTGLSSEEVLGALEAAEALHNMDSLDDPEWNLPEQGEDMYGESESRRLEEIQLKSVIGKLSRRDRSIIVLRYFKDMTQQEIADRLGISQVQVSRLEKRILSELRRNMG